MSSKCLSKNQGPFREDPITWGWYHVQVRAHMMAHMRYEILIFVGPFGGHHLGP